MDLLKEIEGVSKIVGRLREENKRLEGTNRLLIEKKNRVLKTLKSLTDNIDVLINAQGKPQRDEKKGENI